MPSKPTVVNDGYHENMVCKNCGFCCTLSPKLIEADIVRIRKLGFLDNYFVKESIDGTKYMKHEDGKCVFLRIEGKKRENISCEVYNDRPIACRIYPSFDHKIKECPNKNKSWKSCKDNPFLKPVFAFK